MMWFIVTLSAIFVYFDATKNKIGKIPDVKGFLNMSAGMWSFGVIFLWIIIFPLYLFKRSTLIEIAKENPQTVSMRGAKLAFLSLICITFSATSLILAPAYNDYLERANGLAVNSQDSYYTHDDFRSVVLNKTEQEVISTIGRPSQNQDLGQVKMWYYYGITYDSVTQNKDSMVQVSFLNGRVDSVNFM